MKKMTVLTGALVPELNRFKNFRRDDRTGYFYILEYSNGTVKIGSTRSPRERMLNLHYTARTYAHGGETRRVAISAPHPAYRMSEKKMHEQLSEFRINGTELFEISFDDALNHGNAYSASLPHLSIVKTEKLRANDASWEKASHRLLDFLWADKELREMTSDQILKIFRVVGKAVQIAWDANALKK